MLLAILVLMAGCWESDEDGADNNIPAEPIGITVDHSRGTFS